jgi:hypothetical protein
MTTTQPTLTLDDLEDCLNDEEHLGWGYAIRDNLSASRQARADKAVVAVANELGLTKRQLFHWTNSKYGRWMIDGMYGRDEGISRATVRNYLNHDAVAIATENGSLS